MGYTENISPLDNTKFGPDVATAADLGTGGFEGEIRYVIDEDKFYFWDGTTWQPLGSDGITPNLEQVLAQGSQANKGGSSLILRDGGVAYGPVISNIFDDATNRVSTILASTETTVGAPDTLLTLGAILADTIFTIPASDRIDLGVDLLALPTPVQVAGVTPGALFNSTYCAIKSDSTNAGTYVVVGIANGAATNSVAILANLDGTPANITSAGTAKLFNLRTSQGKGGDGGTTLAVSYNYDTKNVNVTAASGSYTQPGLDGGVHVTYFNGSAADGLINLINLSGGSAYYLRFGGSASDKPDIKLLSRTSEPTNVSGGDEGGIIYSSADKTLKIWDGTGWRSVITDGSTLTLNVVEFSAATTYTVQPTDDVIVFKSSGELALTLPDPTTVPGKLYRIVTTRQSLDDPTTAARVSISASGGSTVGYYSTYILYSPGTVELTSNGSTWLVTSHLSGTVSKQRYEIVLDDTTATYTPQGFEDVIIAQGSTSNIVVDLQTSPLGPFSNYWLYNNGQTRMIVQSSGTIPIEDYGSLDLYPGDSAWLYYGLGSNSWKVLSIRTKGSRIYWYNTSDNIAASVEMAFGNSTSAITLTLPSNVNNGHKIFLKNINTGPVTISGGTNTIDGQPSLDLPNKYDAVILIWNSTEWSIF